MSCPFKDDVCLLPDRELPFARRMVVEAHLAVCEECARIDDTLDRAETALRDGDPEPLGVVDPLLRRFAATRPASRAPLGIGLAAAAAALVAVFWPREDPSPPAPPVRPVAVVPLPGPEPDAPPSLPPPEVPDLRGLVASLDTGDADAAESLATVVRRHGAAGTSALAELLDPDDPETAARALSVAERAPSPRFEIRLVALLSDPLLAPRAARLLGTAGTARCVPALEAALGGDVRVEAREALVALGAVDALARGLAAAPSEALLDALVRADAARGARALLDAPEAVARPVLEARREALLPALRRAARGGDAHAIRALAWAADAEAAPLLRDLALRAGTAEEAAAALVALGTTEALEGALAAVHRGLASARCFDGAAGAEAFLLDALRRGTLSEQETCLGLLARCGGAETVRALAAWRPPRPLRHEVVTVLGRLGGADAVAGLARFKDERGLQRAVVAALGATGEPAAVPVLEELSRDRRLASECARALGSIDNAASAHALVTLLERRDAAPAAATALAELPAEIVVPLLLERFEGRRVRPVLARIAGADLGGRVEAWRTWWDSTAGP